MLEKQERERIENTIAEIIDPEAFENQTWDRDRQYKAIKKAEETIEIALEEIPSAVKNAIVRELEDDDDIKVLREEELEDFTPLSEHATVQGLEDALVFREEDFNGLRSVSKFISDYDFEGLEWEPVQ